MKCQIPFSKIIFKISSAEFFTQHAKCNAIQLQYRFTFKINVLFYKLIKSIHKQYKHTFCPILLSKVYYIDVVWVK